MPAHRPAHRRTRLAATAFATALLAAGCGGEDGSTVDDSAAEFQGGNPAPDEAVTTSVEVNAVQLAYPDDGVHEEGAEVQLYAALTNNGTDPARLVDVTGPDFGDARLVGAEGAEGAIEVPENDNVYLEPEGPPAVVLLDLGTELRSSESVEVTFVFEDLPEVTLEAPVASEPPGDAEMDAPEDPSPDN